MCGPLPRIYNGLNFQHGIFHYFTYLLLHRRFLLSPQRWSHNVTLRFIPSIFGYVRRDWFDFLVLVVLVDCPETSSDPLLVFFRNKAYSPY